jgi:hypothetical protein
MVIIQFWGQLGRFPADEGIDDTVPAISAPLLPLFLKNICGQVKLGEDQTVRPPFETLNKLAGSKRGVDRRWRP